MQHDNHNHYGSSDGQNDNIKIVICTTVLAPNIYLYSQSWICLYASRKAQKELARHIVEIDKLSDDPKVTKELYLISAEVLRLAGFKDNGVALDISEYLHEKVEHLSNGIVSDGWEEYAYKSLIQQLDMI